jgi:hypothetical protein
MRAASAQAIRNHRPVEVARGTLTIAVRRAVLPGLSGGTDLTGRRGTSPLLLCESRDRYPRTVDRRAVRVPRFATLRADVNGPPRSTDAGGFESERTVKSALPARPYGAPDAAPTTTTNPPTSPASATLMDWRVERQRERGESIPHLKAGSKPVRSGRPNLGRFDSWVGSTQTKAPQARSFSIPGRRRGCAASLLPHPHPVDLRMQLVRR